MIVQTGFVAALSLVTLLMIGLVWVILTAQLLLAILILGVYVMLGPICIPFLLTPPLNFFFWGWFKALLKYSLYGAVAGALLAMFSGCWDGVPKRGHAGAGEPRRTRAERSD